MQSEQFDNKVREAAENHHPPYDEKAWAGMEKLLNKHLPQKDDRRKRIIFFLLLFLLLGGGGFWLLSSKPWQGNKEMAVVKTTMQQTTGEKSTSVSSNDETIKGEDNKLNKEETAGINLRDNDKAISSPSSPNQNKVLPDAGNKQDWTINSSAKNRVNNKKTDPVQLNQVIDNNTDLTSGNGIKNRMDYKKIQDGTTNPTDIVIISGHENNKKDVSADKENATTTSTKPVVSDPSDKEDAEKDKDLLTQKTPEKKSKTKSKKSNSFFFTLSAGPDFSFTPGDNLGKTKLLAGGGLGYTFKDRLTVRSGFYTGRKVYTSSPGAYHPPASFWAYYPNLEKVEADCEIYEIPLTLSYHFGQSSKQNWFASAGLSSYLMKKETYNYFYKYTAGGPTVQKKWIIEDENKHYFSVLTVSGGYQKNIGKSLSLMVEPYFKVPLSGVGFGKVKLNSGGVLFTLGIKPFNSLENKKKNFRQSESIE